MTHTPLFRDLSDAEKGALLLAKHRGQRIQMYDYDLTWGETDTNFYDLCAYRIAPTPDTIDWSHVGPEWRFAKRDCFNIPWLSQINPDKFTGSFTRARVTTPSFRNNGMPWDQSLIERPENE